MRNAVVVGFKVSPPFHIKRILDLCCTAESKSGLLSGTAEIEIKRVTQQQLMNDDCCTEADIRVKSEKYNQKLLIDGLSGSVGTEPDNLPR
jgi:rare lipoprotein A (peptidoglycan hydrolase)